MLELIFEIGCEELPAHFVEPALEQMETAFAEQCAEHRIETGEVRTVGTPRRLTLLVDDLAETQTDLEEERTGPPSHVAFGEDGEPTQAAEGFAASQGVDVDDLYVVESEKGGYAAARVFDEGEPVEKLLPEMLDSIIRGLNFPKSMRWATNDEQFGRPVRWLVAALCDGETKTVPVEFAGVESGVETSGHRFAAPGFESVESIDDYLTTLREKHVIVDPEERRSKIRETLEQMASEVDGRIVEDSELVAEVSNLVENVYGTRLDFGEKYLELPDEVLISSMRSHQRYFAIEDPQGEGLLPHCGVIYNTPVEDPEVVNRGNLRVLRARLDDGRFFWDKDRETRLEERLDPLEEVVWLEQLGSMRARCQRISETAEELGLVLNLGEEVSTHAGRAGLLSKADLVTYMVDEFPDLQGVMGREYALEDGEPEEVAVAIYEQYLPAGAGSDLPETDAGACVALAEKLDALVGTFAIGLEPTSASDPYALRRAALGIIRIIEGRGFEVSLERLFWSALETYGELVDTAFEKSEEEVVERLKEFFDIRLKYLLTEDYATDVVDSVLSATREDLVSVRDRIEALDKLRDAEDFEPLALGFKRVVNILRKQVEEEGMQIGGVDVHLFEEEEEEELYEAFWAVQDQIDAAIDERDWESACAALIKLKQPVDAFFDTVMVMTDDEALKKNRIALLDDLRTLFLKVADISKIQT